MESKYYAPTIDEFYVGFEYEHLSGSSRMVMIDFKENTTEELTEPSEHWTKLVFSGREFDKWDSSFKFDSALEDNQLRVKYLDKEDIESLGFKLIKEDVMNLFFYEFEKDSGWIYNLKFFSYNVLNEDSTFKEHKEIVVIKRNNTFIFNGTIKNKSELKKLLKKLHADE